MWFNLGLSFFIHLMIVFTMFMYDFLREIWHSTVLRYAIILLAVVLEVLYFIMLYFLR